LSGGFWYLYLIYIQPFPSIWNTCACRYMIINVLSVTLKNGTASFEIIFEIFLHYVKMFFTFAPAFKRKVGWRVRKEIGFRPGKRRKGRRGKGRKKYLDFFGRDDKILYLWRP